LYCQIDELPKAPTTGNFANPKQPSPNFGFGQNIVPENTRTIYISFFQDNIAHQNLVTFYPEFLYGITDYLSLYTYLPIFVKTNLDCPHGGIGDLLMQLEYALYMKITPHYCVLATLVGNITIPTAHISSANTDVITPPIGYDAPSFFIGSTLNYLSPRWYAYISPGATIPITSKQCTKFGNTFFYQVGIGCNLGNPADITLIGLLEFSGQYIQKNKINCIADPNSGGNTIFLGPSIYATHERWEFWGGIQAPIVQNLNGTQDKERYRTSFSISITF
jgi:hypothetical protein